jgi:hypothetical protein
VQPVLPTDEHHGMQHPDGEEQPRFTVPWPHANHVQADSGERAGDQAVVRVLEMKAKGPAVDQQPGDQQHGQSDDRLARERRGVVGQLLLGAVAPSDDSLGR